MFAHLLLFCMMIVLMMNGCDFNTSQNQSVVSSSKGNNGHQGVLVNVQGVAAAKNLPKITPDTTWSNRAWGSGKDKDSVEGMQVVVVDLFDTSKNYIERYVFTCVCM